MKLSEGLSGGWASSQKDHSEIVIEDLKTWMSCADEVFSDGQCAGYCGGRAVTDDLQKNESSKILTVGPMD